MKLDLLLVGGGREKDTSNVMTSIATTLADECSVGEMWIDNHGYGWLEKTGRRVVLVGNRLHNLDCEELIIGGDGSGGVEVEKVWPVIAGANMASLGLTSMLEFGGFEVIGSSGMMNAMTADVELARLVFGNIEFLKSKLMTIKGIDWGKEHLKYEDQVGSEYKFPLEIRYGGHAEKVSVFESFSNIIFKIFEEGVDEIEVIEMGEVKENNIISFVGGSNFLPSKIGRVEGGVLSIVEDREYERELQMFLIDFVKKYDVKDFGMIYVGRTVEGWGVEKIDLMPDLSIDGLFAKLWNESGLRYDTMIKKIYNG